jgi:hypothetical protein
MSAKLMTQDKLCFGYFSAAVFLMTVKKVFHADSTVLIDLFIRLGYITGTPDNEPDFMNIVTRLHSRSDYEKWKR